MAREPPEIFLLSDGQMVFGRCKMLKTCYIWPKNQSWDEYLDQFLYSPRAVTMWHFLTIRRRSVEDLRPLPAYLQQSYKRRRSMDNLSL